MYVTINITLSGQCKRRQ